MDPVNIDPINCREDKMCEEKQDTNKSLVPRRCKGKDLNYDEICQDDKKDGDFLEKDQMPRGYGFCKVTTSILTIQIVCKLTDNKYFNKSAGIKFYAQLYL